MGSPVFLLENLISTRQFPDHVVDAEEESAGTQAFRVADGRKTTWWTPTTANSDTWHRTIFDRIRGFNVLVLWEGHNLAGEAFELQATSDATDFSGSVETILDLTLPSVSMPTSLDDGALTPGGTYLRRFPLRTAIAERFFIPLMGAGEKPIIPGAWLGLAFEPDGFHFPFEDQEFVLEEEQLVSGAGWIGISGSRRPRVGRFAFTTHDAIEDDQVHLWLVETLGRGRVGWLIPDSDRADQAVAIRATTVTSPHAEDSTHRRVQVEWREWAPE